VYDREIDCLLRDLYREVDSETNIDVLFDGTHAYNTNRRAIAFVDSIDGEVMHVMVLEADASEADITHVLEQECMDWLVRHYDNGPDDAVLPEDNDDALKVMAELRRAMYTFAEARGDTHLLMNWIADHTAYYAEMTPAWVHTPERGQ